MIDSHKFPIRMWSFKQLDDVNRKYSGNLDYKNVLGNSDHWNSRAVNNAMLRIFLCRV